MTQTDMSIEPDIEYWLALNRTPGIGAKTCEVLLDHFASPKAIFHSIQEAKNVANLSSKTIEHLKNPNWALIKQELAWINPPQKNIISRLSPWYPRLLQEIPDPPPLLFVQGNVSLLSSQQIAMVGARNPTPVGYEIASNFAKALTRNGFIITSGLAIGIDEASHRSAIDNNGATIAVMGTGLNTIYPAKHRKLAIEIINQGGALISEFPLEVPPKRENFPRRNRVISGLTLGTLVVEAAQRSGSLITARLAGEQGREVFAIPGSIHNPLAKGCHALIRQGAKLVETVDDILEEIKSLIAYTDTPTIHHSKTIEHSELDSEYAHVLNCLGFEPTPIDLLINRCGLVPEAVSSMLLMLELQGYITSLPGGLYSRVKYEGNNHERKYT